MSKQSLEEIIKSVTKEFKGKIEVRTIDEVETPYEQKVPTGIMSMDAKLRGGFPGGSMIQVYGAEGVGKDYFTNLIIAEQQRLHGEEASVLWLTFGYLPDKSHMTFAGVDVNAGTVKFLDLVPEQGVDAPAETMLNAALKFIGTNAFKVVIINELLSGETADQAGKGLDDAKMRGGWANMLSDFCRKFYAAMRTRDGEGHINATTTFEILPVRANMDPNSAKYNPNSQSGGHALKHAKAVDLELRATGKIRNKTNGVIGKTVSWRILKGKHGIREGLEGEFDFYFDSGIDRISDLVNTAKVYGVVRSAGRWAYILDLPEKVEGGMEGVKSILRADPALAQRVREATLLAVTSDKTEQPPAEVVKDVQD